jgi:hypothetical protein
LREFFSRCHVGQREAHTRKFSRKEFGVGLGSLGDLPIEFGSCAVSAFLTVLSEKDERSRI